MSGFQTALLIVFLQHFVAAYALGQMMPLDTLAAPRNSLGASVGFADFHQKDTYLSPRIFGGGMFTSKLSYVWRGSESRHAIEAFFSTGGISADLQARDGTQSIGYLAYSYTHAIARWTLSDNPLVLSVGGGVSSFVTDTDLRSTDVVYNITVFDQSWYWSHAVNITLLCEYKVSGKGDLSVQLTSPLARLVTRPQNGHWLNGNNLEVSRNFLNAARRGQMEYFWDAFDAIAEIEYRQRVSDDFEFVGTYLFGYASTSRPDPMLSLGMYANHVMLGISWLPS